MKWLNSLAFRFWLAINSLVLTGVLLLSGIYYQRESANLENSLRNQGYAAAKTLNSAIGLYMLEGDYSHISPLTYSLLSEPNIAYVIVKDKGGITVDQKGETTIDKDLIIIEKESLEYFQEKVGTIEIALKTNSLVEQRKDLFSDTLLTALIISFISLLFSFIISKGMSAPIRKLITATKKLTVGERNVQVVEKGIIEIQELSIAFNKMSQTINSHEKILVSEINKATKDLSEKVAILEALANISSSVLEDKIQRFQVMKSTLESLKKHSKANHISLAFLGNKDELDIYELDLNGNLHQLELTATDSVIHAVIKNKEPIIHNNLSIRFHSIYEEILINQGMHSLLILPIIANNKVIGTLNVASIIPNYFSKQSSDDLSVFINQIALAIDRVAAYESLQYSAYHDFLTNLPNYRLFKIRINEAIDELKNQPHSLAAVLFLDIDRFKAVNDTLGHATGDLLLIHVGEKLLSCISNRETVTRIGGDEFSILLPKLADPNDAVKIARKVMKKLEEPVIIKGYEITISVSIGIAYYPNDGLDADSLIKHADQAMYRVKEHGKKNYAIYTQPIDDNSIDQLSLESDLRKALEKNEIVVFYQPKINIQTGSLAGLEALIRWNHPTKGLITPGYFIPQAEETGLIVPIGEFVLREATKQCVVWQSMSLPPIPISVNLSSRQLLQTNLVSSIEKILIETNINPNLLELEITESMSMDIDRSLEILDELKQLGVQISVDDFGTGYSSLSYLRRLPIDRVKIDQSFIRDMTLNPSNQTLVSTIINMAHNLNLVVTAEGVETFEQAQHLQGNNCDEIQGFYFSKPIPAEDFVKQYHDIMIEAEKWRLIHI